MTVLHARCTRSLVQIAEEKAKSRSNQMVRDLFIAETVTKNTDLRVGIR
jgi:hypothetical protein